MHRIKPWHWGATLILFAMVVLIYLGWKGLSGQRALLWKDAQTDCHRWSQLIVQDLPSALKAQQRTIKLYPYPPTPGPIEFNPNADLATLDQWQREGGTTTTGLPVEVLARLSQLVKNPNKADALKLAEIAQHQAPSAITPNVLDTIEQLSKKNAWQAPALFNRETWNRDEQARNLTQNKTNPSHGWYNHNGELWWLDPQPNQTLQYIHPSDLEKMLTQMAQEKYQLPNWAGLEIHYQSATIGDSGQKLGETTQLTFSKHLNISVGVIDTDLLEYHWKKSLRWNTMMMALASLGLISGIAVVGIGAAREKKRSQQQNNFIASVTHELRAPVGSIRLMAEALDAKKVTAEKIPEFHHLLAREGVRLSNLIENVLDLSRIEAGKSTLHLHLIDLTELATRTADALHILATEKQINIDLCGDPLEVMIDPTSFQQALINLLDNAIKFSPENTSIQIDWGSDQKQWWISVTDSGPGVPEGEKVKIFNRFYRTGDEMKRETQGAGIGLSLVKHIVEAHGGTIQVKNQQPTGAKFHLTFPQSTS